MDLDLYNWEQANKIDVTNGKAYIFARPYSTLYHQIVTDDKGRIQEFDQSIVSFKVKFLDSTLSISDNLTTECWLVTVKNVGFSIGGIHFIGITVLSDDA